MTMSWHLPMSLIYTWINLLQHNLYIENSKPLAHILHVWRQSGFNGFKSVTTAREGCTPVRPRHQLLPHVKTCLTR